MDYQDKDAFAAWWRGLSPDTTFDQGWVEEDVASRWLQHATRDSLARCTALRCTVHGSTTPTPLWLAIVAWAHGPGIPEPATRTQLDDLIEHIILHDRLPYHDLVYDETWEEYVS